MRSKLAMIALLLTAAAVQSAAKTRIALITPERSALTERYAVSLEASLESNFRVLDRDLAATAYSSLKIENPFNQTRKVAKRIGTLLGCDHFVLMKTETARRSSSSRSSYFESSAFLFLVDSRTGELKRFVLSAKQAASIAAAEKALADGAGTDAASIAKASADETSSPAIEFEMFDPDSKAMRPAMPYRRIKPIYTDTAFLYDVKATVDAEVSIDANGAVTKIDIVRWAGFGLDEAVIDAINKMSWRAGERNGKPLPMRVLLRYNFTKIEKES